MRRAGVLAVYQDLSSEGWVVGVQTVLPVQKFLEEPAHIKAICEMIPDTDLRATLMNKWTNGVRAPVFL